MLQPSVTVANVTVPEPDPPDEVKVIEALACGVPVIGSDVSFEGIDSDFIDFLIECKTSKHYVDEINCIDFSLLGRIKFKENFILRYNSNNILKCVN